MKKYLDLIKTILTDGVSHDDRTGVGRRSVFATQTEFNLQDGFPAVTSRTLNLNAMIHETLWFLSGDTDIKYLRENYVHFWDKWAVSKEAVAEFTDKHLGMDVPGRDSIIDNFYELQKDSVGPMYGKVWRSAPAGPIHPLWPLVAYNDIPPATLERLKSLYLQAMLEDDPSQGELLSEEMFCRTNYRGTVDQMNDLLINLRDNPYSARHVVSAWIPGYVALESMSPEENVMTGRGALAACHCFFQCFVLPEVDSAKPRLSLQVYIRSSDVCIGLPTNIAQYALLLSMLAHVSGMEAYKLIVTTGDTHLYLNHLEKAKEQVKAKTHPLPKLCLNPEITSLWDFKRSDIEITGYTAEPPLTYTIAK